MRHVAVAVLSSIVTLPGPVRAQQDDQEPMPASVKAATSPGPAPSATASPPAPVAAPAPLAPAPAAAPLAASPVPAAPAAAPGWSAALSHLPSLAGPIGLFRMTSADVGTPNHLRLGLHGEYFRSSGVLVQGDTESRLQGAFRLGYTPMAHLELFSAVLASNNRNVRSETPRRDPEVIRAFGDVILGGKAGFAASRIISVAAELGVRLNASVSGLSFSPDSTSGWVNGLGTIDLRGLSRPLPLRGHLSFGYYLDNSGNLQNLTVGQDGLTQFSKEVALFAYGIGKSRVRLALGAEAPLDDLMPSLGLRPFVEYHLELVTASADRDFTTCDGKKCSDNRDAQWLTVGARVRAWRSLVVELGLDLRLHDPGFAYGPRLAPYNIIAGVALPIDLEALLTPREVTRVVERVVEKPVALPAAHVRGVVRNAKDGSPVGGAVVAIRDLPLGRVATDPDGSFRSVDLRPGPTTVEISAPGFEPVTTHVMPQEPRAIVIEARLVPRLAVGNLHGKVLDAAGRGIEGASVKLMGPDNFEARTDASGMFSTALPAGSYRVHVEAPGLPAQDTQVEVVADQDRELEVRLVPPPAATPVKMPATITMAKDSMKLKLPIRFNGTTPKIARSSMAILNDVADAMQANPEIRKLHIGVHWDTSLPDDKAQALTEKQADALKSYLIGKGVAEARIDAVGEGAGKPRFPNMGPAKSKNRRVELRIDR